MLAEPKPVNVVEGNFFVVCDRCGEKRRESRIVVRG
jgi:hypothetical protein